MSELIDILLGDSADTRNRPLEDFVIPQMLAPFWQNVRNLTASGVNMPTFTSVFERCSLHAIHRFHLPSKESFETAGSIPFQGHESLLERRYGEAIDAFLLTQDREGPNAVISSALAEAYHRLAFQTLANQVRRSVRSVRGNQWMFRVATRQTTPCVSNPGCSKKISLRDCFPS